MTIIASVLVSAATWMSGPVQTIKELFIIVKSRAKRVLLESSGASHFIELLIGILIVVIVGALFMAKSQDTLTSFFSALWDKIKTVFSV